MSLTKGKGLRNFPKAPKGVELFSAFASFLFESFCSKVRTQQGPSDARCSASMLWAKGTMGWQRFLKPSVEEWMKWRPQEERKINGRQIVFCEWVKGEAVIFYTDMSVIDDQ